MKTLHRHRQNVSLGRCWFYNPPQHNSGPSNDLPRSKSNREKLEPHIQKWNDKRETLCNKSPKDCSINIHTFLEMIHELNSSWATEKSLDLKTIKGEFNQSCMALCSGCEKRITEEE